MIKTFARLRSKFGGRLEDCEVPASIRSEQVGFEFVSKIENLPKELFDRYSMIRVPDGCIK